jgi:predicted RNase H-like HicB family nuclease
VSEKWVDPMTNCVGILDGGGRVFGVRFPDLPGCYGGGATPEAAIADAMSAAREWMAHRKSKNQAVPKPRTLAQILQSESIDSTQGEAAVSVQVARL